MNVNPNDCESIQERSSAGSGRWYRITAGLLAPVIIQKKRQANASETLDYIPGSTLCGAAAASFFRHGGEPEDKIFRTLFVDRPIAFPNLLPARVVGGPARVLPLTALTCKDKGGFLSENGHGVRDGLVGAAAKRILKRSLGKSHDVCSFTAATTEKACESRLESYSGYWNGDPYAPRMCKVSILYRRHTGIDRLTGTVAPEIFYTTQAIADLHKDGAIQFGQNDSGYHRQYLTGDILLDDEQHEYLCRIIREKNLFVGADRTRGFGEVELTIDELEEAQTPVFDIKSWNDGFRTKYGKLAGEEPEEGTYFCVKLESPAILVDMFLRPTLDISHDFPGVTPVLKVTRNQILRGWQTVWRMPKPDDLALSMGSVFLFRYRGQDFDGLFAHLSELVRTGIGLRREEGFGRVSICDPIHVMEVI